MPTRARTNPWLLVACVLAATAAALGAPLVSRGPQALPPAAQAGLSDRLPLDPQITAGTLPNGLRYYIRANTAPQKRAELRLVVKAGSILEEDDQLGLAHFLEHMAFNGTTHFPKLEVVKFLESTGMRFGPSVNAMTSFDETVYMLQVPTDKPEILDKAFLILEDWAHGISFDPEEIDKERGVVTEEWRQSRGAAARANDKRLPILLKGSRYADRLPIGKMDVIQNFKPERLKQFYADWYRPDLMAVIAVGDFDRNAVETIVKQRFSPIAGPAAPKPRPAYDVPEHPGTLYSIVTDKEAPSTTVEIDHLVPARPQGTVGVYRQKMADRLFFAMLMGRLSDLSQKSDAPVLAAGGNRGQFVNPSKEMIAIGASVKEDDIGRALDAIVSEVERIARFGFTPAELERQKATVLRNFESLFAEKNTRPSATLAAEYIRNFLQDEPLPGIAYELALHQRFLPEITLAELSASVKDWFRDTNRFVIVGAPEKAGLLIPDEQQLAGIIKTVAGKELKPYVDTIGAQPLLEAIAEPEYRAATVERTDAPESDAARPYADAETARVQASSWLQRWTMTPGAITRTATKADVGITEWVLSNGVRVVLKPTTFREDEVVLRASSPGGTSLASDQDFAAVRTAASIVGQSGVSRFNASDLGKVLAGKGVLRVTPFITETEEGLDGIGSRKDLETMFQLIYLRFTQPRADQSVLDVEKARMRSVAAGQQASPDTAFSNAVSRALYQDHPRRRPVFEQVDQLNLEKSMAFYKDRFADASDFTFVFVGSFDLDAMKPLVERYLAKLPALQRKEASKDTGVRYPAGIVERRIEKGIEPKSRVSLLFTGPFEFTQTGRVVIRAMANVLQTRLREALREEMGGTYNVGATGGFTSSRPHEYTVAIDFTCDPKRTDDLVTRVFQEVEKLKASGPAEQEVNDARAVLQRDFETNSRQNGYLATQISLRYQQADDVAGLWAVPEYYKKLDGSAIHEAARKFLDTKRYVKATLFPEQKSGSERHLVPSVR